MRTLRPLGGVYLYALRGEPGGHVAQTTIPTDLQIVQVPIDDLHPDPANPRKIGASELDALTRSLREFGATCREESEHHVGFMTSLSLASCVEGNDLCHSLSLCRSGLRLALRL